MKIPLFGFAASLLFSALISHQVLSTTFNFNHNISISLSENDTEIMIKAKYPTTSSNVVTDLLINHFNLNETADLTSITISNDQTTDQPSDFNLQSKPGSLKMVIIKSNNTAAGLLHFKAFCEKLKNGLAQ